MDIERARIFISCGQKPDEMEVANQVKERLENLGFEAYLAKQDHTLRGLKENIFQALEESEYFLFIDFCREPIGEDCFRGSLFTNQELALASYLELPSLGFQENGIKRDGMLGVVQLNALEFSSRTMLPDLVEQEIKNLGWRHDWKNRLEIFRDPGQHDDISYPPLYRVFHVGVKNLHKRRPAINCTVIIERARESATGTEIEINEMVDVKWTGVPQVSMTISPKATRYFDGCHFYFSQPNGLRFFLASNYGNQVERFERKFLGIPSVDICFAVHSENFPTARAWLRIESGSTMEQNKFVLLSTLK